MPLFSGKQAKVSKAEQHLVPWAAYLEFLFRLSHGDHREISLSLFRPRAAAHTAARSIEITAPICFLSCVTLYCFLPDRSMTGDRS